MQKLLKYSIYTAFFSLSLPAFAAKYDFTVGAYSYNAKVSGKTTTLSGFGTYEASYLVPVRDQFEINLGYSFTMTNVIGGDYSYGPKIGFNYFPLNFSSDSSINVDNKIITIHDSYKPYIGVSFNQRQFQSAKTSYAGIGLNLGMEKYINEKYTLKVEMKMNNYTGASNATATEMNILTGLVFGF